MKRIIILILALIPTVAFAQKGNIVADIHGGLYTTPNANMSAGISVTWEKPVSSMFFGAGVGADFRKGTFYYDGAKTPWADEILVPLFVRAGYMFNEEFGAFADAGYVFNPVNTSVNTSVVKNMTADRFEIQTPFVEPQVFLASRNGLRFGVGVFVGFADPCHLYKKGEEAEKVEDLLLFHRYSKITSTAITIHLTKTF